MDFPCPCNKLYSFKVVLFVVCLILAIVYLIRRVKRLNSNLQYAMSDVRNIAHKDTFKDRDTGVEMNYKGLHEEI